MTGYDVEFYLDGNIYTSRRVEFRPIAGDRVYIKDTCYIIDYVALDLDRSTGPYYRYDKIAVSIRPYKEKHEAEKLKKLVMAVSASEFEGITCHDIDGKNWFDLRDELLGP